MNQYEVRQRSSPIPANRNILPQKTFQPKGVKTDRTVDFIQQRLIQVQKNSLEEGRLARRLEKLVVLHFSPPIDATISNSESTRSNSTLSAISEFGDSLRGKSVKDLWNSVAGSKGLEEKAEQAIVKWQEDSEATRCPICIAQFGLKTRRHHCRLCGRVVCFLPPTPPIQPPSSPTLDTPLPAPSSTRRERCSTFITYEYDNLPTSAGEEKILRGSIIEIETVEVGMSINAVVNDTSTKKDERKKVRVCRDCFGVVMRQQIQNQPIPIPPWLKLYEMLVQLEKEIEATLPEFQELVLGLQKSTISTFAPPSTAHVKNLRKSLLQNLATYDTISKRIKGLPLTESSPLGGSQDRLQQAIATRGTVFLTNKLSILRTLGNVDEGQGGEKVKKGKGVIQAKEIAIKSLANLLGAEAIPVELMSEREAQLSVLIEQENLVLSFVKEANSKRLFDDAASLSLSLVELREEIARLRSS